MLEGTQSVQRSERSSPQHAAMPMQHLKTKVDDGDQAAGVEQHSTAHIS